MSYGAAASGLRAAEALRLVLGELQIADVRQSVGISLIHDFENFTTFAPGPQHAQHLGVQLRSGGRLVDRAARGARDEGCARRSLTYPRWHARKQ